MDTQKALDVLKQVLDAAVKASVFPNMDAAFTAANAYNYIAEILLKKEDDGN
jgi:hypothetical protein